MLTSSKFSAMPALPSTLPYSTFSSTSIPIVRAPSTAHESSVEAVPQKGSSTSEPICKDQTRGIKCMALQAPVAVRRPSSTRQHARRDGHEVGKIRRKASPPTVAASAERERGEVGGGAKGELAAEEESAGWARV